MTLSKVFQGHHEYQPQKTPLDNLTQEDNSMLKNVTSTEEPLNTGSKSSPFFCGKKRPGSEEKCYYISCELKTYEDSKKSCKKMDYKLLKIEDETELLSSTEGSWVTRADNIGSPEEPPSSPELAHLVHPPAGAHLFHSDQTPLEGKLYCTDTEMSEENTTYVDLKHLPSKKHLQKEIPEIKETIIYAEVNISTSNSRQTKISKNKSSTKKAPSFPFTWCLTVVILGIFGFFLLVTTGIWGLMVFQGHHEYQPQKTPLDNLTQEDNSILENVTFTEERLNTGSKNRPCEKKWRCSGEKCYYFSCELKTYEDSKKSCKKMHYKLLKIEDETELKFIQSQLSSKSYYSWIGLSRKEASLFWTWEDNSPPSLPSLFFVTKQQTKTGNCVKMAARKIDISDCSRLLYYLSSTEGSWVTRADNIGSPEEPPSSPELAHLVHPPAGAHLFHSDQTPLEGKLYCTDTELYIKIFQMNEKNTTYIYLKHLPSEKHMPKDKIKGPPIYSEVKNTTSNSNQTKITRKKSSKRKASSVPFTWCLTLVILGIFCFLLLVTTGILGLMVFQGHHKCQPQELPLDNVKQEDNSVLKNMSVTEEPLNTGSKSSTCERKWSCCGEKCYYFSHELKSFEESKRSCHEMNSALLKIDDEKELRFLESQLPSLHWIGLSRKEVNSSWMWADNSPPLFKIDWQETKSGNCARMTAGKMVASQCSKSAYYICRK
ncbi:uncharacterized protein AAES06_005307 [Glossophaga mutica]